MRLFLLSVLLLPTLSHAIPLPPPVERLEIISPEKMKSLKENLPLSVKFVDGALTGGRLMKGDDRHKSFEFRIFKEEKNCKFRLNDEDKFELVNCRKQQARPHNFSKKFHYSSNLSFWLIKGKLFLKDRKREYWSIAFPWGIDQAEQNLHSKQLMGYSVSQPKLFFLPKSLKKVVEISWEKNSQIVSLQPCDAYRSLMVENMASGISRFTYFRGQKPYSYTKFDFTSGKRKSRVFNVLTMGCSRTLVSGDFGIIEVKYP